MRGTKNQMLAVFAILAGMLMTACGPASNTAKVNSNASSNTNANSNTTAAVALNPSPTPRTCEARADGRIRTYLDDYVLTNAILSGVKRKFNYHVKDCVVYLSGHLGTIERFKLLETISSSNKEIIRIDNERLWLEARPEDIPDGEGACGTGLKPCGDICIPIDQDCNTNPGSSVVPTRTP